MSWTLAMKLVVEESLSPLSAPLEVGEDLVDHPNLSLAGEMNDVGRSWTLDVGFWSTRWERHNVVGGLCDGPPVIREIVEDAAELLVA
jgi:hypothetical protein